MGIMIFVRYKHYGDASKFEILFDLLFRESVFSGMRP